jgi:general secretion pathway protein N
MRPLRVLGWASGLVLTILVAAVTALAMAPATWLDLALERASGGRVRLAEASGTIWQGQGRLVFAYASTVPVPGPASGTAAPTPDPDAAVLNGVALPGRMQWKLAPLPLLVGMIDAQLQTDGMKEPARLQGTPFELRLGNSQLALARTDLGALGSPWSTVRPAAALRLVWEGVSLQRGRFDGRLQIELRDVSSALSAVRPLGSYRIVVSGRAERTAIELETLGGALRLSGRGEVQAGRLRFTAQAAPADPADTRLLGLLGLLGPREGDQTVIRIGG